MSYKLFELIPVLQNGDPASDFTVPVTVQGGGGTGGGPATIADGADVAEGTTTDAAVVTDANGTISAKLRGLIVILLRAFALSTPIRIDPVGSTAQPVSGTVTTTPPSHASTNVDQIAGQAPALNAGTSSAGTPRVVQASAAVLNVTQPSVLVSSTLVIAANANRIKVRIINTTTNPLWIGPTNPATVGNGAYIPGIAGYPWTTRYEGALYAIATGGTALVTVDEEASA